MIDLRHPFHLFVGDELVVEYVLEDHDKLTKNFKVGEPEDNTHDKDNQESKLFTKYLQLKKTNVRLSVLLLLLQGPPQTAVDLFCSLSCFSKLRIIMDQS